MVFFRVGSSPPPHHDRGDAFAYLGRCFLGWSPARFGSELYAAASNGFYANAIMVAAYYVFVVLVLALAFYLDTRRAFAYKNKPAEICLAGEKRWAVYYALVVALLVGYIIQSGGFGNSGFGMYAGFYHAFPEGKVAPAPGEGVCTAIAHEWVAAANSPSSVSGQAADSFPEGKPF